MAITVRDLIDKLRLKVVYGNESLFEKEITTADISRPGLEMTGYFDYYLVKIRFGFIFGLRQFLDRLHTDFVELQ